jgi:hypothetical protein
MRLRNKYHTSIVCALIRKDLAVDIRIVARDLTQVQAFELATDRKITDTRANLTSRFAFNTVAYVIEYSQTNVTTRATMITAPIRTASARADIITRGQLVVNGGYVRGAFANLQVQAFELVTGSKFSLEPRLQLYIDQETRIYLVKPEDTQLKIYSDGIYKITPESRIFTVKQQDPVNTIPGIKL